MDENNNANREEAVKILAKSAYVGADAEVIANSMTGTFEYEKGDKRDVPDFNVFFRHNATYPYYSDAIWYLTQMRRWGQIADSQDDEWYMNIAKEVYRPDIYQQAAEALVEDGVLTSKDSLILNLKMASVPLRNTLSTTSSTTALNRTLTLRNSQLV
ncbi:nitrate ABC transporter nitrate-binding protein [Vibrio variabilis]|uniref:Nitrate ABC transporter nitrate-binding protein n=1 Tax=Vibrio variabilis TaxID=990271 RepID=A0ABQ0JAX1_9VIBR|nr:nitrate ABC transporter nitrate-binding protein [Vibrio variabilis]